MQIIISLIEGVAEALPELVPAIVEVITQVCQTLIDNLPLLLDAVLQLITGLAEGILNAIPVLIAALPEIISAIVDFLLGAIPQIIDTGIQLLTALVGALPEIIQAVVAAIPQIIDGIVTAVIESIPLIIQAGIDLLVALVEALPEIITTIVEAIPQIIDSIITAIIDSIPLLIQAGIDLFVALIRALPDIITAIVAAIPQIIDSIVTALINSIPQIIEAGVTLFIALIENLPTIIVEIVKAIPQIIEAIVSAFGSFFGKMAEVGLNLIKGVWQGISDAAAWLWDKISGFFSGIVSKIKGFFGIHSPSTVFAEMGGFMAEGLGEGFSDEMDAVGDQMMDATAAAGDVTGLTAIEAVKEGLLRNLGILDEPISKMVSHMGELLAEQLPEFVASAMTISESLVTGLATGEGSILDKFTVLIEKIQQMFASARRGFVKIGQRIMEGIGEGITSRSAWLNRLIMGYINAMKQAVEASLGIHSPSKVFAEIGGYMAEGMGAGFEKQMDSVRQQMEDSIPTSFNTEIEASPASDIVNGIVSSLSSVAGQNSTQTIVLQVQLDSKTIAQTIFDPLRSVAVQRGVSYG